MGVWGPAFHLNPAVKSHLLNLTSKKAILETSSTASLPSVGAMPKGEGPAHVREKRGQRKGLEDMENQAMPARVELRADDRGEKRLNTPKSSSAYLPRNQVLEPVQLVLVFRVVPGILLSEEGLGET
jgi:hypothetical protein